MKKEIGHSCTNCKCLGGICQLYGELAGIIKLKPEITYNKDRTYPTGKKAPDGIEIRFGATRPTTEAREMLKAHGFKFSEKQTIWYARDNAKSRDLATYLENNEIEADDTQYEKRHFWTKVASLDFYNKMGNYTEFMTLDTPPRFFWNKRLLEKGINPKEYIYSDRLRFKKFYNKIVGEDGEEKDPEEEDSEKEEEEGEGEEGEREEKEPSKNHKSKADVELADKLKDLADGMQKSIDAKINSATSKQRPTPKRLRVAAGMREEGYYLRNIQVVLYALSKVHREGVAGDYPLLKNIRSKAQVEILNKIHDVHGKKHEDHYIKSVFSNNRQTFTQLGINSIEQWSEAVGQKEDLVFNIKTSAYHQQNDKEEKIRNLEMEIKSMKISGFFPTPPELITEILEWADIKPGQSILEPSAGKGDILDAIKKEYGNKVKLSACEIHSSLRQILELKGYEVAGQDFLELDKKFDRIIMNPPFETGKDAQHVTHALTLLKPGGRVVAIMGEGVFFRKFSKDTTFREMLADKNAHVSEPIKNAFKDAFNQTGVNVRYVVINQDGTYPEPSEDVDEEEEDNEENERLEMEALAELEVMKLKLEIARKKKGLNGIEETREDKLNELRGLAKDLDQYPDVWNFS